MSWELTIVRIIFVVFLIAASVELHPFGFGHLVSALVGAALGVLFVLFEIRLEKATLKRLIGAAIGSILGIFGALMMSYLLSILTFTSVQKTTISFMQVGILLLMAYMGLILGANKGDLLNLSALGGLFSAERSPRRSYKVLDTSVIIDGRIADICETGFIDGTLVIPQFVLRELQLVADSSDPLK